MNNILKSFASNESLYFASKNLLNNLGIKCWYYLDESDVKDEYFKQKNFNFQYSSEVEKQISHIWQIGYIDDNFVRTGETSGGDFESLLIFACDINPNLTFTRKHAVDITRALNRCSCKSVDGEDYDIPVIVILRQGKFLSIATCERTERQDKKGSKMGKVSLLRNVDCERLHPGHRQILEGIAKNVKGSKSFNELYSNWLLSFSNDIISDNFFAGYKAIYEDIIALITGKRMQKEDNKWVEKPDEEIPAEEKEKYGAKVMASFSQFDEPEKAVRDYVKKLMGRLVFIQFLQKKGWMGVPADKPWGEGNPYFLQALFKHSNKQETFVDDVLEPLFNDLNTDRAGFLIRSQEVNLGKELKAPYLNGGLFEEDAYDRAKFAIPAKYFWNTEADIVNSKDRELGLLQFFYKYNFTIDENAPDDVEVGVDPEMLSRIFENLLEDNKEKGAFYTPKEIVRYMCRESLIAYLTTYSIEHGNTNPHDQVEAATRTLVLVPEEIVPKMTAVHKQQFGDALRNVKICDPAIGSGAFPMGMLNELVRCRVAIGAWAKDNQGEMLADDLASLKCEIICNNIYGVDIERGAIDIARLRFWLSIVVDEKTPQTLPNLDYKFMQGNSLITTFDGEYVDLDTKNQKHDNVKKMTEEKKKLHGYKNQYYSATGDQKHELAVKIKNSILTLVSLQLDFEYRSLVAKNAVQTTIFGSKATFSNIKVQLSPEKQRICDLGVKLRAMLNDVTKSLTERSQVDIRFFDWRMMFTEVFEGNNPGFDIVIGNPPYIRQEKLASDYKTLLASIYPNVGNGIADIFVYFFGIALDVLNDDPDPLIIRKGILKTNGVLSFITSNKFLKTKYGKELRDTLTKYTDVKYFIDFFELPVFHSASTDAGISLLTKCPPKTETRYFPVKSLENLNLVELTKGTFQKAIKKSEGWEFIDPSEDSLIGKISADTVSLKEFTKDRIYRGVTTGLNKCFIIKDTAIVKDLLNSESKQLLRKYAEPTEIKKWGVSTKDEFMVATYPSCAIDIEKYPTLKHYLLSFSMEKLEQTGASHIVNGETIKARKKTNNKWFETQDSIAYWEEFDKPKILYIHTAKDHQFYLDTEGYHVNNSCYLIVSDSRFLFCFLNSKIFKWLKKKKFVAYGDGEEDGRCKLDYNKMITVPIKTNVNEKPFEEIVDAVRAKIKNDPTYDPSCEEQLIDRKMYELYGLTNAEVKIIDPNEITTGNDDDLFKA